MSRKLKQLDKKKKEKTVEFPHFFDGLKNVSVNMMQDTEFTEQLCIAVLHTLLAGLLPRSQYPEDPAPGHLDTGFSWFPCVYKQMLRWFPRLQVATTVIPWLTKVIRFGITFVSRNLR